MGSQRVGYNWATELNWTDEDGDPKCRREQSDPGLKNLMPKQIRPELMGCRSSDEDGWISNWKIWKQKSATKGDWRPGSLLQNCYEKAKGRVCFLIRSAVTSLALFYFYFIFYFTLLYGKTSLALNRMSVLISWRTIFHSTTLWQ